MFCWLQNAIKGKPNRFSWHFTFASKPTSKYLMAFMRVKDNVVVACGQGVISVDVANSLQCDGVVCPVSMPTRAGQVFSVLTQTTVTLTCNDALNTLSYISQTIV